MAEPLIPIPQPPAKPLVGNLLDLDPRTQVQGLMTLARRHGDIFFLRIAGRRLIVVSGFALVDELCDESRFDKRIWAPLREVRAFTGDGLFTALTHEPNWAKAHHILLPNFSGAAMRGYHDKMLDVARQLVDRWARVNPREEVDVGDAMTRLTLDTIGLCGFDYRFNSFYRERPHPFVEAMVLALSVAMSRSARPGAANRLRMRENARFRRAVALMNDTVDTLIRERRAGGGDPGARGDLLGRMLTGRDPESGEGLDDLNIRHQILTFLIAGHETTSGLLSFALYFLVKHPEVLRRAREEVDGVLGADPRAEPTYEDVGRLRYLRQVLDESLRLWPTAPMFALYVKAASEVLGGRYEVVKADSVAVLAPMLHRDPSVWGADAEAFDPDRFAPAAARERPANAFKPFGNGQRACIGRQFATHEAVLALALVLHRLEISEPAGYRLEIQETLTLKPRGFRLRVEPRDRAEVTSPRAAGARALAPDALDARATAARGDGTPGATATAMDAATAPAGGAPLLVLYGSNMGTSQGIARRIGEDAQSWGFDADVVPLDARTGDLPRAGAVVVVSSSYNGAPPDNARRFLAWLESGLVPDALTGVSFTVFGVGHRDWASTYQAVPARIDRLLAAAGARRLHARGEGDGAGDFDGDFEGWYGELWPAVGRGLGFELGAAVRPAAEGPSREAALRVEVLDERHQNPFVVSFGAAPMVVVENRELQGAGSERSTRHLELAPPEGVTYRAGDHLGVVAENDERLVRRVLERFGFDEQTRVVVRIGGEAHSRGGMRAGGGAPAGGEVSRDHATLPVERPITVSRLLREYVELQDTATRTQIRRLAERTQCPPDRRALDELYAGGEGDGGGAASRYRDAVLAKRLSVLDLLEAFPACELPFAEYLAMLPALRPRYYSISSSPLCSPRVASITVGVVCAPALSGRGVYRGACSTYLAQRQRGATVHAFVRDTDTRFRLPEDCALPIVMAGAGTGLAPFRGFLQERAAQREARREVGASLLLFGCRRPDHDLLYRDELEAFEAAGLTRLACAFSRQPDRPKTWIQHRLRDEAAAFWELYDRGAIVYVCGDAAAMEPGVRGALRELWRERTGGGEAPAAAWVDAAIANGRYRVDVWASGR
ncbi:MAG TPA: cytochrome P450 [Thermoanaerobaculia bacterium]|nr:cytochrome P450 [Thermoanaerobaculia bacterium]